jgi:DNA-binding NarL/FixJ family response regulator
VTEGGAPLRVALIDDYEVVLVGVAHMFASYDDRVQVVEINANQPVRAEVDIALFDTFAQNEADGGDIADIVADGRAVHVVVYTWNFDQALIDAALHQGASGYLSKTLPAGALVEALERINAGEVVISPRPQPRQTSGLNWPGRVEGLTEREAEIIALITQAKTNAQIAAMTYLSINTIKGYVRSAFRKIGVRTRTEAALWGVAHGFLVDVHRIEAWKTGSHTLSTHDGDHPEPDAATMPATDGPRTRRS